MNFDLSQDQKMLVDTAASFARKSSPVSRTRTLRDDPLGFDRKVWKQMAELGWLGLCVPEDVGGFGGRFVDLALVLEQLGKTLVPEPIIPTVVLGGTALARGSAEQRARWLTPLASGELQVALAWAERDSRYRVDWCATRAERAGAGYKLTGEKTWVLGGHAADLLLVTGRTAGAPGEAAGVSLFAVDRAAAGVEVSPVQTLDGRRAAMVRLAGVDVAAERVIDAAGAGAAIVDDALDAGGAAACAEAVGIAQAVLAMTVDYLKTREQFGAKIGTFQALQHRAVEMFVEVELLRSHSIEASLRIDEPGGSAEERRAAVSAALVQLAVGGRHVVRQGIQLHGGIGCTDEHDIGLYFKRMQALSQSFGDEEHHLARFADLTQPRAGA